MESKQTPYSLEAEQSVLGSILLDNELMIMVGDILSSEDFYKEAHTVIYEAMLSLYKRREPIDLVTLMEQLKQSGQAEISGGVSYLSVLSSAPDYSKNVESYAHIVKEKSIYRELIRASNETLHDAFSGAKEIDEALGDAEKRIFDISQSRMNRDLVPIKNLLLDSFEQIREVAEHKGKLTGLTSGFIDLDEKTNGFQKTDLVLVAARPAMGKTAFALNLAQNAAIHADASVAIFNLEMSKEQLIQRMIASISHVELNKLKTGNLKEEDWYNLTSAMNVLSAKNIYIDDTPGISPNELRSKCRRLKMEKGLDLVVIDYLQLMESDKRVDNRQQEISNISRSLKILAKELNCPVIALSQLSRGPELRSDHTPMLSDLRESGAIEQDADIVMFLYREEYYKPDTERKNITDVIIAKHRHGEVGTVNLTWLGQYQLFHNAAKISY